MGGQAALSYPSESSILRVPNTRTCTGMNSALLHDRLSKVMGFEGLKTVAAWSVRFTGVPILNRKRVWLLNPSLCHRLVLLALQRNEGCVIAKS